jgi:quercetin dioxygenase-like cupin family protein
MDSAARPQLRGLFCRLGPHHAHDWTPLPFEGISNKVLMFDRVTGATMELARVEQGAEFPEHYHTTVQTLFLVSGRLRTHDRVIEAGTFNVIPAGELHGPFYAEEEAIQLKYFSAVPVYILRDGTTYIYREDGTTISAGRLDFASKLHEHANFISG